MATYRRRMNGEVVDAVRYSASSPPAFAVHIKDAGQGKHKRAHYAVPHQNGWYFPNDGEWVVTLPSGSRIVVSPDVFTADFEAG